ncbi:phytoene/squalene synthase family protein [Frateuria aurantia]
MTKTDTAIPSTTEAADRYQDAILPKVSRTFALTIPQLPAPLCRAVGNAYLLCRIADTVEDEPALSAEDKRRYEEALIDAVNLRIDPAPLAAEVASRLSSATLDAERELFAQLPTVLDVTRTLRPAQQAAIENCLRIMASGMHDFQIDAGVQGLATLQELDHYCYIVAGCVGDLLTDMFVDFDPEIAARGDAMRRLSVSFGQGLQMTNILKDQWEDRRRGACWLPRDLMQRHGVDLAGLVPGSTPPGYQAALDELIGIAVSHLSNALEYTLLIPARHAGIRRFCLWALGMAVLTLQNLHTTPGFSGGTEVKITRKAVRRTIMLSNIACRHDWALRGMFKWATRKLPRTPLAKEWSASADIRQLWTRTAVSRQSERMRDLADATHGAG